jgi:tetratricopeptide (TPR) repeat protein
MSNLQTAQALLEKGDIEGGWNVLKGLMSFTPNDPHLLIAATYCMQRAGNWPVAYHLANASVMQMPDRPEPYLNLGAACDQMYLLDEGLEASKMAYKLADTPKLKASALMNHASLLINNGKYAEAEPIIRESLKLNPASVKAKGNLGMCLLAQGQWREGWANYSHCLGTPERAKIEYGLPEYKNGDYGTVVVYGEQGLGDEISFASMINDFPNPFTKNVVIDCDYRLKGLFSRSFPRATVHGGRWKEKYQGKADFQVAMGDLGKFYRNSDSDFPRKPYLEADPVRRAQWKYLKEQTGKPLIGIAWTGGMAHTGAKYRRIDKTSLAAIVQGIEAHFVSLEYKEREPVDGIHVYPHATLTDDYDDTAALVAECDLVITIQTAVAHLAGALGVPCLVLVPEICQWRYAPEKMLWYGDNFNVYKAPWDFGKVIADAKHYL